MEAAPGSAREALMLRTLVFALALAAPGLAAAQQFPESAVGVEVVGDDGAPVGRVRAVERDAHGRIVAAEIPGLEPGNAPYASRDLVADNDDQLRVPVRQTRDDSDSGGAELGARTR
jgi:hypothetical protein